MQISNELPSTGYSAAQGDYITYTDYNDPEEYGVYLNENSSSVDLAVTIIGIPNPAELDDDFKYEVLLTNYGPGNAYDISFTAEIPGEMEYLWATSAKFGGCMRSGNKVTCTLDSLLVGDLDTITIAMRLLSDGQFTASATVTSIDEDLNPNNNQATCYTKVYTKIPIKIGSGGSPSIAVDDAGTVHFCYLSEGNEGKLLYATLQEGIINIETIDNAENNFYPAITIDKKGIVHIAYGKGEYGDMQLRYRRKTGGLWTDPQIIEANINETSNLCIKTDKNDSVHISYLNSRRGGQICYLKRNVTWSKEVVISGVHNSSSFDLDTNGHAHFAYYLPFFKKKATYELPGLKYITNSPDGMWQNFEDPDADWKGVQFSAPVTDISVDRQNRPHISYVGQEANSGTEDYKYVVKSGGSWSEFFIETGTLSGGPNAIGTDPFGNPHILYLRTDNQRLKYATYFEGEWKKLNLDYNIDYYNDQKLIDICGDNSGNVHIAYVKNEEILYILNPLPLFAPKILVHPAVLEFGTVDTGNISVQLLYLINDGGQNLQISDIKLAGDDSAEFSLEHACSLISQKDTCIVQVTFKPEIIGEKRATLQISSNDPETPVKQVPVNARTPYPVIQINPEGIIFDPVEKGKTDTLSLIIENAGDSDLKIDSLRLTGSSTDVFELHSDHSVIPPSEVCEIKIMFSPLSDGSKTGILNIFSNDPEHPQVNVSLKGRSQSSRLEIGIQGDTINFGIIYLGNTSSRKLLLSNTGEKDLVISSLNISGIDAPYFHTSNSCAIISPGSSCNIELIFSTESPGLKSSQFTLTSNDPDQPEHTLIFEGTGIESQSYSYLFSSDSSIIFYCTDTLSSGDFILGGFSGDNAYLTAISPKGDMIWQKEYSSWPGNAINALRATWDKGIVIAGRNSSRKAWIAKLDRVGQILWQKQTENDYYGSYIQDIIVTSDSCFVAVGGVFMQVLNPKMWIVKFDSTGNLLWQRCLNTSEFSADGCTILESDDGNYIIAGSMSSNALQKHPDGGYLYAGISPFLCKISPDGDLIWKKEIVTSSKFIAHISSNESILWQYYFPSSNIGLNCYDISTTRSGDIILLGSKNSSTSEPEMWITRLTKFGEIIWQKEFLAPESQFCYKLINEHSSGYIGMAGLYRESENMITNGWMILLNSEGLLDGCEINYFNNSNATINPATYHFSDIDLGYISASVNFTEGSMVESEGNAIMGNLCTGIPSDADNDGIPNEEEYGPSAQDPEYDGNDDGLPDALQNNVASFYTFDGLEYITLEAPKGAQLIGVTAVDNPSPDDQPEEFDFPLGFFDFAVTGINAGESLSLNIFIPEGQVPVTYFKYSITTDNQNPHWYEFSYDGETGAEIEPGKIILNFRDGKRGDEDLNQNDTIKDIGGPAIYEVTGIEYQSDRFTGHFRATIYPNPFRISTRINFTLAEPVNVHIEIYDFLGRKIKTLVNEKMMAGDHELELYSESLADGIYYLRIEAGEYQDMQKIILLK